MTRTNPFADIKFDIPINSRFDWVKNDQGQLETTLVDGARVTIFKSNVGRNAGRYSVSTQDFKGIARFHKSCSGRTLEEAARNFETKFFAGKLWKDFI